MACRSATMESTRAKARIEVCAPAIVAVVVVRRRAAMRVVIVSTVVTVVIRVTVRHLVNQTLRSTRNAA